MTNRNFTPNYLFSASERELLTLSFAEIISGLVADYKGLCRGNEVGVHVPDKMQEPRMMHSCILFAEGLRLAPTHLDLAKKLIMTSLFESNARAASWFAEKNDPAELWAILQKIEGEQALVFEEELLLFRLFGFHARAVIWLVAHGSMHQLKEIFKAIEDHEAFKTEERNKEEEEVRK